MLSITVNLDELNIMDPVLPSRLPPLRYFKHSVYVPLVLSGHISVCLSYMQIMSYKSTEEI